MKSSELQEHRARFLQAYLNGYSVALADEYVSKFETFGKVSKGKRGSAEHLLALVDNAIDPSSTPTMVPQEVVEPTKVEAPATVVETPVVVTEEPVETVEAPPEVVTQTVTETAEVTTKEETVETETVEAHPETETVVETTEAAAPAAEEKAAAPKKGSEDKAASKKSSSRK